MKAAIVSFTAEGTKLNIRLAEMLREEGISCSSYAFSSKCRGISEQILLPDLSLAKWTGEAFMANDALIFVGACGIAVRSIAPFVKDKFTDPAVIVIDEKGEFIIPLLSGHVGGGNKLAMLLADKTGGQPVITTATDVRGRFAVDVFARENKLHITSREKAKIISADILSGEEMAVYVNPFYETTGKLPEGLFMTDDPEKSRIMIDVDCPDKPGAALWLIPESSLVLGIGCKKGKSKEEISTFVDNFMKEHHIHPEAVSALASIDVKAGEEGIIETAKERGWSFFTYSAEQLMALEGEFSSSDFVLSKVGVDNVCERAALMCTNGKIIIGKEKALGITLAAAIFPRRINFE